MWAAHYWAARLSMFFGERKMIMNCFKAIINFLKSLFSSGAKIFIGKSNIDNSVNINGDNNQVNKGTQVSVKDETVIFTDL